MSLLRHTSFLRLLAALALWASAVVAVHPAAHAGQHPGSASEASCCPAAASAEADDARISASHSGAHDLCLLCTIGDGRWAPAKADTCSEFADAHLAESATPAVPAAFVRPCEHEHSLTRRGPPSLLPA